LVRGQVMKRTQGRGDPKRVAALLEELIAADAPSP
jgi:Asp-tRNA(Asn)/Glu-tRNA(Gln) amidotransferase B subunit